MNAVPRGPDKRALAAELKELLGVGDIMACALAMSRSPIGRER
jgi:hypothetical protein